MKYLTFDIINRIRDEVLSGKPKKHVAKELGIDYRIVKELTKDIRRRKFYTKEDIQRIRKMVIELGNKAEVARRLGIPYYTVLRYTLDIKVRNKTFGERTWEMLKEIMEKGFIFTNSEKPSSRIYILRKHFPRIQWVRVEGKGIAFLPEKKEEAVRAFIQRLGKKVWSYQKLKRITKLFDADLTKEEKLKLMGRQRP